VSGSALSYYTYTSTVIFRVIPVGTVTLSVSPPLPAIDVLAAGQKKNITISLSAAPTLASANVWVLPLSSVAGALTFEPAAVLWSNGDFASTRNVTVTAVTQPADTNVTFAIAAPVNMYELESSVWVPLQLAGRQELSVTNYLTTAAWGTSFTVNIDLSQAPSVDITVLPVVELTPEAAAALPIGASVNASHFVSASPEQVDFAPLGSLNGTVTFTIIANETHGEQDFQISYLVLGSDEFGRTVTHRISVISTSRLGISNWQSVRVTSPSHAFNMTVSLGLLPTLPDVLNVDLNTAPQYLHFQPSLLSFSNATANSVTVQVTAVGVTGSLMQYAPRLYGSAAGNYSTMATEYTTLALNNFSIVASSGDVFDGEPVSITLTPTYEAIGDVRLKASIVCDTLCQQNILLPGDAFVSPDVLVWHEGDSAAARFVVSSSAVGKTFLVQIEIDSDPLGVFGFSVTNVRVTAPPPRYIDATSLPAVMYVGAQYPVSILPSWVPAESTGRYVSVSIALAEAVLSCSPAVLTWGRGGVDTAVVQTTLCTPSIAVANVSYRWIATSTDSGFRNTDAAFVAIQPSTPVGIAGLKPTAYVGASIIELRFSLPSLPVAGDTLMLTVASNNSGALSPEPKTLDLTFGVASSTIVALFPGRIVTEFEDVLLSFETPSVSGRFVPSQRTAIVRLYRPKRIRLTTASPFVDVGASIAMTASIDQPARPSKFATSFTAGAATVAVAPATLYYSVYSALSRPITVTGIAPTEVETFAVTGVDTDEFFGSASTAELRVLQTIPVLVIAPRTIRTSNASTMTLQLGGSPITGGAIVYDMVRVRITCEPAVLIFQPSLLSFDSAVLTQSVTVSGSSIVTGAKVYFELSGSYATSFQRPSTREMDVANPNVVQVELPSAVEMIMGFPQTVVVELPFAPQPFDTFQLTPQLACPTLATVIGFSVSKIIWSGGSPLQRAFSLTPIAPTAACTLTFQAEGNSTRLQGPSGVWSVSVKALPWLDFTSVPPAIYASKFSTSSITLAFSASPTTDFAVTAVVPSNLTQSVTISPATLAWEANAAALSRTWVVQVNDSAVSAVQISFLYTTRTEINSTVLARPLVIPVLPPTGVQVRGMPSAVYVGGKNARSFSVTMDSAPQVGERVDVTISYSGATGSLKIEPSALSWVGGQDNVLANTVTLEGVLPQASGELLVTIVAPPRFNSRSERFTVPVKELVRFVITPPIPTVFLPQRSYDFTISLPDDVPPSSLPGVVTVSPDFQGIPNCLRNTPDLFRFYPNGKPHRSRPLQHRRWWLRNRPSVASDDWVDCGRGVGPATSRDRAKAAANVSVTIPANDDCRRIVAANRGHRSRAR
jgi:hypothetical protein